MTTFKVPNKTLIILRENCLKLLNTNGSRVTYWRLPTYFQCKTFLLQNLKAMKVSKLQLTKLQHGPQFWWLFSLWWFTQFGVLLSPIALMVVGPLLLDMEPCSLALAVEPHSWTFLFDLFYFSLELSWFWCCSSVIIVLFHSNLNLNCILLNWIPI